MAPKERDTEVRRKSIRQAVRLALWAKNAGRCTFCNVSVAGEDQSSYHTVLTGQMAHNVGATLGRLSPRRRTDFEGDREGIDNLLLLCPSCHLLIDNSKHEALYTTDALREIKKNHEARVALMTQGAGLTRTAAVRVGGTVHGHFYMPERSTTAITSVRAGYLPAVESRLQGDFSYTLTGDEGDDGYWRANQAQIAKAVNLASQAIDAENVGHLSVFAFGPIPLLVHLGHCIGNKVPTAIYQRDRDTGGWDWHQDGEPVQFEYDVTEATAEDIVFTVGVTARINRDRLPADLRHATILDLNPRDIDHGPRILRHEESLTEFRKTFSAMLAKAESIGGPTTRWHLVTAVPVSAAVAMGQELMRGAQPPVAVYQSTSIADPYLPVLGVNTTKGFPE